MKRFAICIFLAIFLRLMLALLDIYLSTYLTTYLCTFSSTYKLIALYIQSNNEKFKNMVRNNLKRCIERSSL